MLLQISDSFLDQIQNMIALLSGDGPPFEGEAAVAGDDVLGRATVDYSNVHGCVGRVETGALIALQLFRD